MAASVPLESLVRRPQAIWRDNFLPPLHFHTASIDFASLDGNSAPKRDTKG